MLHLYFGSHFCKLVLRGKEEFPFLAHTGWVPFSSMQDELCN